MSWFSKWEPKIAGVISRKELEKILKDLAPDAQLIFNDREYLIPDEIEDLLWRCPAKRFKYIKQRRDCDAFVDIFIGWKAEKGFDNLVAMDCTFWYFSNSKQKKVLHKAIAFLHKGKIVFGEPQTGKLVEYDEVKIIRLIV